ncbi:MAG TPA: hypothetical protein VJZ75_01660 [Candidatus Bathyarchaeia archaeon]|nr:hypothetical protein [Candidatus Bathyarchaeia archaeon]
MTDCPTCSKWMPCEAITEMQLGINHVTIRHYACEECGQSWEKHGKELRQISDRGFVNKIISQKLLAMRLVIISCIN